MSPSPTRTSCSCNTRGGKVTSGKYILANGRSAQFPRGVLIHFVFTNKGTGTTSRRSGSGDKRQANPYAVPPTFATANKVLPGRRVSLFGNFYFRGAFLIEKLFNKNVLGRAIPVTIY